MKLRPYCTYLTFSCLIFASFILNFSCSNDTGDLDKDIILDESGTKSNAKEEQDLQVTKTISLPPINDVNLLNGKASNAPLILLSENHSIGFLMFDLSAISKTGGSITNATLEILINDKDAVGDIDIYKGKPGKWSEKEISYQTAPENDRQIGSTFQLKTLEPNELVTFEIDDLSPENITLILEYKNGENISFFSKEHHSGKGPKLVVTYDTPKNAEEIASSENLLQADSVEIIEKDSTASVDSQSVYVKDNLKSGASYLPNNEAVESFFSAHQKTSLNTADDQNRLPHKVTTVKDNKALSEMQTSGSPNDMEATALLGNTNASAKGANQAPSAVVTAHKILGTAPFRVWLTGDKSIDDKAVVRYLWKFKDGRQNATIKNPAHTFEKPGTYVVELTVWDQEGLSNTKSVTITATNSGNSAPVAVVTADKTSGNAPVRIYLKGDKSTDDKGITSYLWQFKDGRQNATIKNPAHTFEKPGTYVVELTVKDSEGLSNTKSITITATNSSNLAPVAVVSADMTTGKAPIRVKLTGSNSTDDNAVTSYLWKFKDGRQNATIPNPTHTFEKPGTYAVELTVTDAQGLSDTKTINIVATAGISNSPDGSYYVTTNGSSNNDGRSEATAWSIEHAFRTARAGDIVYIKAGNYGNVTLKPGFSGTSGNPIRFIGYQSTPGDIVASGGSTFQYGDNLDANKMPLLKGNRSNNMGQGSGIFNFHKYIEISNIQITHYAEGVFSSGEYTVLDNIIVTEIGDFNPAHTYPTRTSNPSLNYSGVGIKLKGDYSTIKNCFVLNAGAEGYHFSECRYQNHFYNQVYSDSNVNPCDYYYLLSIDAQNNNLSNIYVERVGDLEHLGHGLVLKFSARNNTIRNSRVKNTWLELSYSRVADNTFTDCLVEGGPNKQGALMIANGANSNTFNQCRVTRCDGVAFSDWDEDFSRGDVRDAGHHNNFNQCTFDNNLAGVFFFWYSQQNKQYSAHDNTFDGCTFRDMENLFLVDRANSNTLLKNCTIRNINTLRDSYLPTLHSGIPLNAYYQNNTITNCGFSSL